MMVIIPVIHLSGSKLKGAPIAGINEYLVYIILGTELIKDTVKLN